MNNSFILLAQEEMVTVYGGARDEGIASLVRGLGRACGIIARTVKDIVDSAANGIKEVFA